MKARKFLILILLVIGFDQALAEIKCTSAPKNSWKNQDTFKKELETIYKIKKFKVTSGNCYEIYGHDKFGKKVEIYFNPVNGVKIKERIE